MLNRRLLRVKAMQAIYAFKQAQKSDFFVAQDIIHETFVPDLNSMEPQDKIKIDADKKLALELYAQSYETKVIEKAGPDATPKILNTVKGCIDLYHKYVEKDYQHYGKLMVIEVEQIYTRYLSILQLLVELSRLAEAERERKLLNPETIKVDSHFKLADNKVIAMLRENDAFRNELLRHNISWQEDIDTVRSLYKDLLKQDETYQAYMHLKDAEFEDDKQIVDHIIRMIVFKKETVTMVQEPILEQPDEDFFEEDSEKSDEVPDDFILPDMKEHVFVPLMQGYFEEQDLNWTENRDILKSMVVKTIKQLAENQPSSFQLLELSLDWELDKEFFIELYHNTIKNEPYYLQLVSERTKNWDADRLALVDKILLTMAISEMIHCPSIPVKVSINEYIELAKRYSTPKSKIFINGLLDAISEKLIKSGEIKKSGRGLIDNK